MLFSFFNKKVFVLIVLFILIPLIILAIFFVDNFPSSNQVNNNQLKGFNEFKKQVITLGNQDTYANSSLYFKLNKEISAVESSPLNQKGYQNVILTELVIQEMYSDFNDPKIRTLNTAFASFAKDNYGILYNSEIFNLPCQDPTCQPNKIPADLQKIIDEVQQSNVADYSKTEMLKNLQNVYYVNDSDRKEKVEKLMDAIGYVKNDDAFKAENMNTKIVNELIDYLLNNYKQEFYSYMGLSNDDSIRTLILQTP